MVKLRDRRLRSNVGWIALLMLLIGAALFVNYHQSQVVETDFFPEKFMSADHNIQFPFLQLVNYF